MKDRNWPNSQPTVLFVCLLLIAAVSVVFGGALGHKFVNYDDNGYFFSNPHVKAGLTWNGLQWAFKSGYASNWHPLTWCSLMLDAQIFGTGPLGPHLTNVILHAANAVLLLLLLRRLTGVLWPAAIVAAVFAVHPLRVESVAWVAERKDVLSGLFFMLTLLMYARYAQKQSTVDGRESRATLTPSLSHRMGEGARRAGEGPKAGGLALDPRLSTLDYSLALLFFIFGLMSKPMLVTVPFVMLLLDYWPLGRVAGLGQARGTVRKMKFKLILEKVPFIILSAGACVATVIAQREGIKSMVDLPLSFRLGNAAVACVTYVAQMIWPADLVVFYPYMEIPAWEVAGAVVLLAGATAAVVAAKKRCPFLAVGWFWYLGMLVPVIGLVQVGDQSHADRYTYLPQIGLYLAVVWAIRQWTLARRWPRPALAAAACSLVAVLMVGARKQTCYWRDSLSLWERALACAPGNITAYSNMGANLTDRGRFAESIEYYRKVLEIKPDSAGAHNDWGKSLMGMGQTADAIKHLQKAIEIDPDCAEAHNNLANLLAAQGQTAAASEHYQKAMRLRPNQAEICYNFGNLLAAQGLAGQASEQYRKAIDLEPGYAKAHYSLANLLAAQGQYEAADEQFQQAIQSKPDYAEAFNDWGAMLLAQGRSAESIQPLQKAVQISPLYVEAHNNLASALGMQGRVSEAVQEFKKAIEIKPDYGKAHFNLANIFAAQGELDQAREHYQQAAALMPGATSVHYQLGVILERQARFKLAIAEFEKILELDPGHAAAQNNLAWLLATCPEPSLRNGTRAVTLARKTELLSGGQSPEVLDTLAAAYAESGSFAEAIKTAKHAIELSTARKDQSLANGIQTRLKLYESNLPYHEAR